MERYLHLSHVLQDSTTRNLVIFSAKWSVTLFCPTFSLTQLCLSNEKEKTLKYDWTVNYFKIDVNTIGKRYNNMYSKTIVALSICEKKQSLKKSRLEQVLFASALVALVTVAFLHAPKRYLCTVLGSPVAIVNLRCCKCFLSLTREEWRLSKRPAVLRLQTKVRIICETRESVSHRISEKRVGRPKRPEAKQQPLTQPCGHEETDTRQSAKERMEEKIKYFILKIMSLCEYYVWDNIGGWKLILILDALQEKCIFKL